jgi:surface carbohydrate biosynthesis protein
MEKKIVNYFKIFFLSRYIYKLPSRKEVLIYDSTKTFKKIISYYIKSVDIDHLYVRGEFLNLPVFFISLFSFDFFKFKKNYIKTYIKFSNPNIILTCTDNDMVFYTLKNYFKNINFIVLQNGLRGILDNFQEFNDFKKKIKAKLKVDFFFTINSEYIKKYKKYIKSKFIHLGLLTNNLIKKQKIKKKQILFISQFKNKIYNGKFQLNKIKKIKGNIFYKGDEIVLKYLLRYVEKNKKYKLVVCLRPNTNFINEKKLILDILKTNKKINFFHPKNQFDTYREADKSSYVICVDSALGYETYARGCIVGFFSIRGQYINSGGTDFAWPAKLQKKNFWSNKYNVANFNKVMKYISKNKIDYNLYRVKNRTKIMEYDKGNSKFVEVLRLLKAPLKSNIIKSFQIK